MGDVVRRWFEVWEEREVERIPVSEGFRHTSPFGTTEGRDAYLDIVRANTDQFLGFRFEIHDAMYEPGRACVRYTGRKGDFELAVSEWYFGDDQQIDEIVSYYHLGDQASYDKSPGDGE